MKLDDVERWEFHAGSDVAWIFSLNASDLAKRTACAAKDGSPLETCYEIDKKASSAPATEGEQILKLLKPQQ